MMQIKSQFLYIGGGGRVYALERSTGRKAWETELKTGWFKSGKDFVSLVEGLDHLYAVSYGIVFALHKGSGEILWRQEIPALRYQIATLTIDGAALASLMAAPGAFTGLEGGDGDGGDGD
jgi:outer membrane protein assembly factor BamB